MGHWYVLASKMRIDFPAVSVMNRLSTLSSRLVIISFVAYSVKGFGDRVSHQITLLSSPDVTIVLSLRSVLFHTTDLTTPWCVPISLKLLGCSTSNTRTLFSWPPLATNVWEDEISALRTMCSWAKVWSVSPVYVSQSFLKLRLDRERTRYTVKSALADTAFAASSLILADHTAPCRSIFPVWLCLPCAPEMFQSNLL